MSQQPLLSLSDAEVAARRTYQRQPGQLGSLLDAYTATIAASDVRANGQDPFKGWDVWVLLFAWTPPSGQSAPLPAGDAWRATIMVNTATGALGPNCAGIQPMEV